MLLLPFKIKISKIFSLGLAQAICSVKKFASAKILDELYEAIFTYSIHLLLLLLLFWMFADRWQQGGQTLVGVVSLWFLKFNIHWALGRHLTAVGDSS